MVPEPVKSVLNVDVRIEEKSGFCFGVTRVIRMAEEILDAGEKLYCLGQIVHNESEVKRLIAKGIIFIEKEDLHRLHHVRVLIRAHGEPPETYRIAEENNIELVDGTCPIVRKLQQKIRQNYETREKDSQIIIYGKTDHPEVVGLTGQTENNAIVISDPERLKDLSLAGEVSLYSQTTMDTDGFNRIREQLEERLEQKGKTGFALRVNNTICRHISHRQPGIRKFALENDVVIFVAGKKSSNGRVLFDVCRSVNSRSYLVSGPEELKDEWLANASKAGICGATSTPGWLLEEVAEKVRSMSGN